MAGTKLKLKGRKEESLLIPILECVSKREVIRGERSMSYQKFKDLKVSGVIEGCNGVQECGFVDCKWWSVV